MNAPLTLYLCEPRGFCAGVDRAITIVELALKKYGAPIYVRHEIVHNKWVVDDLKARGVVFVAEVDDIPDGGITIFSAHGISQKVEDAARLRDLPAIDATCPLVTKVHKQAQRYEAQARDIILIGHAGHPEVEGTMGRVRGEMLLVSDIADVARLQVRDPAALAYVTQTTLSVDDTKAIIEALKARFPEIEGPDIRDICYATQNRQNAVRDLAGKAQLLLVIGSKNSSNSNRLRDLGAEMGMAAHLIDDARDVQPHWLDGITALGVTAGASAPEWLVQELIDALNLVRPCTVVPLIYKQESTIFKLPKQLQDVA